MDSLKTTDAMADYLRSLLDQTILQDFLRIHKMSFSTLPKILIKPTCGAKVGAQTYGQSLIEVSSWMLEDTNSLASTLRHEFAHVIKSKGGFKGSPHGTGWLTCLQAVSPVTWDVDKHWIPTEDIEKKRLELHPKSKKLC